MVKYKIDNRNIGLLHRKNIYSINKKYDRELRRKIKAILKDLELNNFIKSKNDFIITDAQERKKILIAKYEQIIKINSAPQTDEEKKRIKLKAMLNSDFKELQEVKKCLNNINTNNLMEEINNFNIKNGDIDLRKLIKYLEIIENEENHLEIYHYIEALSKIERIKQAIDIRPIMPNLATLTRYSLQFFLSNGDIHIKVDKNGYQKISISKQQTINLKKLIEGKYKMKRYEVSRINKKIQEDLSISEPLIVLQNGAYYINDIFEIIN